MHTLFHAPVSVDHQKLRRVPLRVDAYYSPFDDVYHTLDDCPIGRTIPRELRREGTGGRLLCPACERRN